MSEKVLCVDDEPILLDVYRAMHHQLRVRGRQFELDTVNRADKALALLADQGPYAVIISDMQMPGMDGIQLLTRAKEIAPNTVRMMLTGAGTLTLAIDALHAGNIFRFLTKPCGFETFDKAITAGLEQYRLIAAEKVLLEKTLTGSIDALTGILAIVSPTAFGRAGRVRQLVKRLAEHVQAPDLWQFDVAAMLSQAGCVAVPEAILKRAYRGAALAPDEAQIFNAHPRIGHDLLAAIPRLEAVARAIAYQEKHFDGSGVPADDKKGADLPLAARILKVALDCDMLESKGLKRGELLDCMKQRHGWYDPDVLGALEAILEERAGHVVKEYKVRELTGEQDASASDSGLLEKVEVTQKISQMVLADNVWTNQGVLVLSKGHRMTLAILERLRNYSRHAIIQEPIRVWVPSENAQMSFTAEPAPERLTNSPPKLYLDSLPQNARAGTVDEVS